MTDVARFKASYEDWHRNRTRLSAQEESGHCPAADEWECSDDTAVELLRSAASLLGIEDP